MKLAILSILVFATHCSGNLPIDPQEDVDRNVAFIHVNVITMANDKVLMDQTVLTSNGVISKVSASEEIPKDYFVVDGSNQYLMPGLSDMHTHVYYEEDLLPYVANGVTSILNMGSPPSILEFRGRASRKEIISPTIFAGAFVDGVGNRGWVIQSPEEAVTDIAQIKSMGWDFIKVYNGIKQDVFLRIQQEAEKNKLSIIGHGVRDPGMDFILSHGQVMVAHMEEYLYTHFHNSLSVDLIPSAISLTKDHGTYVTPNLSAYEAIANQWGSSTGLNTLLQKDGVQYVSQKWKDAWKGMTYTSNQGTIQPQYRFLVNLTKQFHDAGIPLLLGSDSPYVPGLPGGFCIHDELRNMVDAGLSNYQAIETGTRIPGEFIVKYVAGAKPFGLVKEGYRADLILLKANPLDNVENIKKRTGVMANGRWMSEKFLKMKLVSLAN